MPPDAAEARRPGSTRICARSNRSIASAPINRLFDSTLTLPEAGRSEIAFTVAPDSLPRRRRGARHALFQDARRRRFLCRQHAGQRPLPADHRLQPPLHQADEARARRAPRGAGSRAAAGCSSPRRGSSIRRARNARAAPAPSCARTSRLSGLDGYRAAVTRRARLPAQLEASSLVRRAEIAGRLRA